MSEALAHITTEVLFEFAEEAQRWHEVYLAGTQAAGVDSPCALADTYLRQYRVRSRSLEKHEREIAWYGERVAKLRAELERLADNAAVDDADTVRIAAVLAEDDNADADGSAF